MGGDQKELTGPDLSRGVSLADVPEGRSLVGHFEGEAVLLVREGEQVYATAASCTHYGGPLGEGLIVGTTVRCPWHHACFDLKSGAARGPALSPLPCFDVARDGGLVRITKKREPAAPSLAGASLPASVVIVGGGPAGAACADTLRQEGYAGPITMIGDEAPVDRPNLSKDYLAGTAPEEWIPLRTEDALAQQRIEFVRERATAIDTAAKTVHLSSGRTLAYGALVLATGAAPRKLDVPGAASPRVHLLRTFDDARAILAAAEGKKRAVIVGASFIGLEAAASLKKRGLDVAVVGPEALPLARVVGEEVGRLVLALHEAAGVRFHLGRKPARFEDTASGIAVVLDDGTREEADLVVVGVGVSPNVELAQAARLRVENGIVVDDRLRAAPDVWAAGDVARYPLWGEFVRIEHFAVAVRQGQAVARDIVGKGAAFTDAPFFWSAHYDVQLSYVGHAAKWDRIVVDGNIAAKDALVAYVAGNRVMAVLTINRDAASLAAEAAFEKRNEGALRALVGLHSDALKT